MISLINFDDQGGVEGKPFTPPNLADRDALESISDRWTVAAIMVKSSDTLPEVLVVNRRDKILGKVREVSEEHSAVIKSAFLHRHVITWSREDLVWAVAPSSKPPSSSDKLKWMLDKCAPASGGHVLFVSTNCGTYLDGSPRRLLGVVFDYDPDLDAGVLVTDQSGDAPRGVWLDPDRITYYNPTDL